MLELDEALDSELVREPARWSSRSSSPARRAPVRQLGMPVKLTRTPGDARARCPGPQLGEHTDEVLLAAGYSEEEVAELHQQRGRGGSCGGSAGHVPGVMSRR